MADETRRLEPFTVEMTASELPESIVSRLPERPPADARLVVTIEPAESEAEKLAALQRDLEDGIEDLAEGRVSDGADVFARLKTRFPAIEKTLPFDVKSPNAETRAATEELERDGGTRFSSVAELMTDLSADD